LLAAEMLVHDGLGDIGAGGDFLDRRAFEASLGKKPPADTQQLLAAFFTGHPLTMVGAWGRPGHSPIMATAGPPRHLGFSGRTHEARSSRLLVMDPSRVSRRPVSLPVSRLSSGHFTSQAQPASSAHRITRALMS